MATFASNYSGLFSSMESRKRKDATELNCRGVPLPYLIRPRKPVIPFDNLGLYNDYATQIDNEIDEDVSPMEEAVETGPLNKKKCFGGNCFGLGNDSNASLSEIDCEVKYQSDEEYVIVGDVDVVMPDSEKERVGAIHMMELSKALQSPVVSDATSSEDEEDTAIHMMELSKALQSPVVSDATTSEDEQDTAEESKSDDEASSSGDEWVVV